MSLSKENFEKIVATGLYKYGDIIDKGVWCQNRTYKPHIRDDKNYMLDSYWSNEWESRIEVTDSNIDNWILLLDYNTYTRVHNSQCQEYLEEDYICVADDSGGWSYPKHYLKKDAKPSKEYQLNILRERKRSLEWDLEYTDKQIKEMEEQLK